MWNRVVVMWVVLVVLAFSLSPGSTAERKAVEELYNEIEVFTDALTITQNNYVDEIEPKKLIHGAIRGMLSALDPHSQFMEPEFYNEMKVQTEGEFGGLGIVIDIKDDLLTVISPMDGTPAYEAGIKTGDKIVKIGDEITRGISIMDAVGKLRGKTGTNVTITILREGENKLLNFTITRAIIKIQSVRDARILEDNIGYIKLSEFQEKTSKDLEDALLKLEKEGMDSLILDLRNNPGGLLNTAVQVSDKFLPAGKMIVYTKGRIKGQDMEFIAREKSTYHNYTMMIVLVNEWSASASEIVAGAIQDNHKGIIVGTKTFGKGSVQTVIELKDGSALRLTTSEYFTPSGRSIHGEGIIPDFSVELEEKIEVAKVEKSEEVFEKIEKEEGHPPVQEENEDGSKRPVSYDNQLSTALGILKGIKVYKKITAPMLETRVR